MGKLAFLYENLINDFLVYSNKANSLQGLGTESLMEIKLSAFSQDSES